MLNLIGSIESFFKVLSPSLFFLLYLDRPPSPIAVQSWAKEKHAHRVSLCIYVKHKQDVTLERELIEFDFFQRWRGSLSCPECSQLSAVLPLAGCVVCSGWFVCSFVRTNELHHTTTQFLFDECCSLTRLVERFNCTSSIKESAQINAGWIVGVCPYKTTALKGNNMFGLRL